MSFLTFQDLGRRKKTRSAARSGEQHEQENRGAQSCHRWPFQKLKVEPSTNDRGAGRDNVMS